MGRGWQSAEKWTAINRTIPPKGSRFSPHWVIRALSQSDPDGDLEPIGRHIHSVVSVDRPYEDLAVCVARRFDNAELGIWDLPMSATGFRHINGEKAVEIFNMLQQYGPIAVSGVYTYFVTFKGIAPERTEVDILASRDVHAGLGKDYVMTKVMDNLRACGANA